MDEGIDTSAVRARPMGGRGGLWRRVLGSLRNPRALSYIGSVGLEDRLGRQLAVAFAVANFVASGFLGYLKAGWGLSVLTSGLMGVVSAAAGLVVVTFTFCVITAVTVPKARFTGMFKGLAFVQVMTALVLMLPALAAWPLVLAGAPAGVAVEALGYIFYIIMVAYTVLYGLGLFKPSRFNTYLVAFGAAFVSTGLQHVVAAALGGIAAG